MMNRAQATKYDPRKWLLMAVHVAPEKLGISEDDRRAILKREFGVESSRDLNNEELQRLVDYYRSKGWQPHSRSTAQVDAWKEEIGQLLKTSELTEKRVRGLVQKHCGVADLRFAHEARGVKQVLTVVRRLIKGGYVNEHSQGRG